MRLKPRTLGGYSDGALVWSETKEGMNYWRNFRHNVDKDKNAQNLLEYLPQSDIWQDPQPERDAMVYAKLQIIAKYWERFGNLPTVELMEDLIDDSISC